MLQEFTKTFRILLIEDNFTDAFLLKRVFAKIVDIRFKIERVERLQEGLNYLDRENFDIILLDLSLPDSFGLESLKKLQKVTNTVPIIVLTGNDNDELALATLREGAQDYVVKNDSVSTEMFGRLLKKSIERAIERQQIMQQLSRSEALYRSVIEDRVDFICRFSPNGRIIFTNQAFCQYLELTPTELGAQNFFLLIKTEDLALVRPRINNLNWELTNTLVEFRGRKLQEWSWQQWNIRAIFQDKEIVEYQAVGQDISDRKRAELENARLIASLHESQEKVRIMTNSAPVLIWMSDTKGKPTFVNQFCLDFTGKSLEQALVEDWLINIHSEDRQYCHRVYRQALTDKTYFELEYRIFNYQREYRWILQTGVPRFDRKGKFVGFVCSGIDISKRKQAESQLAEQARRSDILAEITKHIHESLKLEIVLQTTTDRIIDLLQTEEVSIAKLESDGYFRILSTSTALDSESYCEISAVLNPQSYSLEANIKRLQKGETVVLSDREENNIESSCISLLSIEQKLTQEEAIEFNCSTILVPIAVKNELWGTLWVQQCSQSRIWQPEEIKLLEQITRQLAIAIKQAELYQTIEEKNQKLQKLTTIDSLTGIANRRRFDEYLASEWKRLAREQTPLCLILGDIDHFKLYNDTYGHQAGDICLQKVAEAVQKTVKRPADLTARYGGEELAVILPNTTLEGAEKLARDICDRIRGLQIPHLNSPTDLYITLSLGVAGCVPHRDSSVEKLLKRADSNLYRAKKMGRNRVVGDNQVIED